MKILKLFINFWKDIWNVIKSMKGWCGVLSFEERLYQGLTNVMYPPEEDDDIDYVENESNLSESKMRCKND